MIIQVIVKKTKVLHQFWPDLYNRLDDIKKDAEKALLSHDIQK